MFVVCDLQGGNAPEPLLEPGGPSPALGQRVRGSYRKKNNIYMYIRHYPVSVIMVVKHIAFLELKV